jgi:hypothetical protein
MHTPGAGMNPENITPGVMSFKDGYFHVTCAVDKMEMEADKYGDERHGYRADASFTARGNVSIVRYADHIDREKRQPMSGRVCFNFCRSIANMTFFGLTRGRDCYCMPYFMKDGTSSASKGSCDLGCEGDSSEICGGLEKSSVYEMHNCANTAEDVAEALQEVAEEASNAMSYASSGVLLAQQMEEIANYLMNHSIEVGDMLSHANGQNCKVFAGKVLHAAEEANASATNLARAGAALANYTGKDFTVADNAIGADYAMADAASAVQDSIVAREKATELAEQARPEIGNSTLSPDLFNSILYRFDDLKVNNTNTSVPTSCEGKYTGSPITNVTFAQCAEACNAHAPKQSLDFCVAFQFYGVTGDGDVAGFTNSLCLLYRDVIKVDYFDCPAERAPMPSFLQRRAEMRDEMTFATVGCFGRAEYLDSNPDIELELRPKCWGITAE